MKKFIFVDTQVDFIDGALRNEEAIKAIPNLSKLLQYINENNYWCVFTQDTHYDNYLDTLEGKKLPIPHCLEHSHGWEIYPDLKEDNYLTIQKNTFGYKSWKNYLSEDDEIYICGFCSDICVISNALIIRAILPNNKIFFIEDCSAGVTPQKHKDAISIMESCQIDVIKLDELTRKE